MLHQQYSYNRKRRETLKGNVKIHTKTLEKTNMKINKKKTVTVIILLGKERLLQECKFLLTVLSQEEKVDEEVKEQAATRKRPLNSTKNTFLGKREFPKWRCTSN